MDRVASHCAEEHNVRTVNLQVLLKAIQAKKLLDNEKLRMLVEQMESADRTSFPYKDILFGAME